MKGIFVNFPAGKSFEGKSGTRPLGPSMTGTKSKAPFVMTASALFSSLTGAALRQANVSVRSAPAHVGTASTNASQSGVPVAGRVKAVAAWEPDSRI